MCWLVLHVYVHIMLYCHLQNDCTPLHCASGYGHLQTVRLLLQRGANMDALDWVRDLHVRVVKNDCTPLHCTLDELCCVALSFCCVVLPCLSF